MLRFFEGADEAQDTLTRRYTLVRASRRLGAARVHQGVPPGRRAGQVRRDDYRPEGLDGDFSRTVTGAIGPYLVWNHARFLVTHGVAGFAREEDVDLGMTVRAGLMFAPKAFGYERDGIAPLVTVRTGVKVPRRVRLPRRARRRALQLPRGSTPARCSWPGPPCSSRGRATSPCSTSRAAGSRTRCPAASSTSASAPGRGRSGATPSPATGSVFATAEYRVTVTEDFLGLVGLGVAGFVDHGGAWYAGSRRRLGWDAGVGLRLGASRTSDTEALRFDLARRFANDAEDAGWVVTVGKGLRLLARGRRAL